MDPNNETPNILEKFLLTKYVWNPKKWQYKHFWKSHKRERGIFEREFLNHSYKKKQSFAC